MTTPVGHARTSDHLPLVSIGVPVHNGGQYLSEALESVLAQDYRQLEVIISDNASSDDTERICRRFADTDCRFRFIRSATNLGAVTNFRRVLLEAHGKYFTWLAHDDVLTERHYISTVVDYLERHPDVVGCASALYVLDYEFPGSVTIKSFPEIAPDRPWPDARREFFIWPQSNVSHSIYGMIRREQLLRVPIVTRTYKGQPTSAWGEMPILTSLCRYGRIVALSQTLRAFRSTNTSEGWRTYQMASPYDLFVLGIRVKLALLLTALTLRLPPGELASLLWLTVQNLFRANFNRPFDVRNLIMDREREFSQLQQVHHARLRLIRSLEIEIANRQQILRDMGQTVGEYDGRGTKQQFINRYVVDTSVISNLERFEQSRHRMSGFFQGPEDWELQLCQQLNDEIGALRRICDGQLERIDRLHTEAASILELVNAANAELSDVG